MKRELAMLWRQVRHELAALRRTPIVLVLAVAFPLGFYVIVSAFVGNETIDAREGIRVAQFLAPAFASFGVVMSTFSFLAIGLSEARASGVLKRQNGTPLPSWALLGGRMGAALLLGLVSATLVIGAGVAFYGVLILWSKMASVVFTLVVASLAFCALGLAIAAAAPTPQVAQALTNGIVIPIAFISDIFTFGGSGVPDWLSTLGWIFPLKHLVNAVGDAFNPYLAGNGFEWDNIAVIVVWGAAGALAAAWLLRAQREVSSGTGRTIGGARRSDASPRRTARPSSLALVGGQVGHTSRALVRDFSAVFFSAVFPVLLVVILPAMNGGADAYLDNGWQLAALFAATAAIYGAAVSSYVSMPEGVAEARGNGVLKREHGTPLTRWSMLLGRIFGALVVSMITLVACYAVAGTLYGTEIPQAWWEVALVVALSTICFAALGLAVVSLVRSAQSVIGITLGTLLPLSMISDIFVIGVDFPPVLNAIGWFFPLRNAVAATTGAAAPADVADAGLTLDHVAVVVAWTVVALAVVALRFRWEGVGGPRPPGGARRKRSRRATAATDAATA